MLLHFFFLLSSSPSSCSSVISKVISKEPLPAFSEAKAKPPWNQSSAYRFRAVFPCLPPPPEPGETDFYFPTTKKQVWLANRPAPPSAASLPCIMRVDSRGRTSASSSSAHELFSFHRQPSHYEKACPDGAFQNESSWRSCSSSSRGLRPWKGQGEEQQQQQRAVFPPPWEAASVVAGKLCRSKPIRKWLERG